MPFNQLAGMHERDAIRTTGFHDFVVERPRPPDGTAVGPVVLRVRQHPGGLAKHGLNAMYTVDERGAAGTSRLCVTNYFAQKFVPFITVRHECQKLAGELLASRTRLEQPLEVPTVGGRGQGLVLSPLPASFDCRRDDGICQAVAVQDHAPEHDLDVGAFLDDHRIEISHHRLETTWP